LNKYYYKPVLKVIEETYLQNASREYQTSIDIESDVRLVINANTPEDAHEAMVGFVDVRMWELVED
jgi:hypothetical protein